MRKWAAVLPAGVAALLGVATVGMAVRSFSVADKVEYVSGGGRMVLVVSKGGRVAVMSAAGWTGGDVGWTYIRGSASTVGGTDYGRRVLGFGAGTRPNGAWFVNVPYWFIGAVFAGTVVLTVRGERRRRKRLGAGTCPACGYDMRATPARCPECGKSPAAAVN